MILEAIDNSSKLSNEVFKNLYGHLKDDPQFKEILSKQSELGEIDKHKLVYDLFRSHNMLIQGKSGSGKTELLRETAKICNSPFIKVDAVRYTEVGYYGDDVENIITNLYQKTMNEFENSIEKVFWDLDTVKASWESFILQFLLGSNFQQHSQFEIMRKKLHNRELENVEVYLWFFDLDKVEKYFIKEIRDNFWSKAKYRIQNLV